jgi:hydroxypyruvate isomerase
MTHREDAPTESSRSARPILPDDRWSAHVSVQYLDRPLAARPHAAVTDGFRWVETWWIDDIDAREAFLAAIRASPARLACMNAAAGDLAAGERGMLNRRETHQAAVNAITEAIRLVGELGGRTINVLVGRQDPGASVAEQLAMVRSGLREVAPAARTAGVTIAIEHINSGDIPGYLLPTPRAAADLVEAVGDDAVRLLYDAYHAARMGLDAARDVRAYAPLIGHAQYAGAPQRSEPGSGSGDPWAFAQALLDGGYSGPIGLEYQPATTTTASLWALARCRPAVRPSVVR